MEKFLMDDRIDFLERMVIAPSPSGFEQQARAVIQAEMRKYVDELRTDVMGNIIGVRNAGGKPRVMITGHYDEIGLIVSYISNEGFIYFSSIATYVDPHIIPGQRVFIHTKKGKILGVVGKKPVHILTPAEREKVTPFENQWIDIGAENGEEAKRMVSVGDPITFAIGLQRLEDKDLMVSRGFDDKVGVFVIVETLRKLSEKAHSAAVFGVATVQEEIGNRGAYVVAHEINPQVGIVVDVEFTSDTPGINKQSVGEIKLGMGPVLTIGACINPVIGQLLMNIAKEEKIPHQIKAYPKQTLSECDIIQLTRSGIATALIGIPCRYMHTPNEVISLTDLDNTLKLLVETILRLNEKSTFLP